jgi:tetratricopeptide (TPR) repeat protein
MLSPRARQAADAPSISTTALAEAHVSLANAKFHYDRDLTGAASEFQRAIILNPNYPTAQPLVQLQPLRDGRARRAIAEIKRAEELDPRSPSSPPAVANVLWHARRFDEAIEQCRKGLAIDPARSRAHRSALGI